MQNLCSFARYFLWEVLGSSELFHWFLKKALSLALIHFPLDIAKDGHSKLLRIKKLPRWLSAVFQFHLIVVRLENLYYYGNSVREKPSGYP